MDVLERDIIEKINSCKFKGLKGIRVGDALYYYSNGIFEGKIRRIKAFRGICRALFFNQRKPAKSGTGRIVFSYSTIYSIRSDFLAWFKKVYSLVENKSIFLPTKKMFTLKKIKHLPEIIQWNTELKKQKFHTSERYMLISRILQGAVEVWDINEFLNQNRIEPSLIVVVCDAHLTDSFICQWFNYKKVSTASLQHGVFEYNRNPWVILGSHSENYLIYGESTRRQFLKAGCSDKKLHIVGMPTFIEKEMPEKVHKYSSNVFGVVLLGKGVSNIADTDVKLLSFAEWLAQKTNWHYDVKLHPGTNKEFYGMALKSEHIRNIYVDEINCIEFGYNIRFAISGCTTVFYEFTNLLIPMFIYRKADCKESYFEGVDWCMFDSKTKLYELFEEYIDSISDSSENKLGENIKETRNYFSVTNNIAENYRKFFKAYDA